MEEVVPQTVVTAIRSGDIDTVRLLYPPGCAHLEALVGERKSTALNVAVLEGQLSIVQYLVSIGCDLDHMDGDSYNCAHLAAWYGHSHVLDYLGTLRPQLFHTSRTRNLPIHIAAFRLHSSAILACSHYSDINRLNSDLLTPLRICIERNDQEGVKSCLQAGARITRLDLGMPTSRCISEILNQEYHWRSRRCYVYFVSLSQQLKTKLTRIPLPLRLEIVGYL